LEGGVRMRFVIGVLVVVSVMLASLELYAGDEDSARGECRPVLKRVMHKVREIFKEKDANGDGVLTLEEWGPRERLFNAIDRNDDGQITPRELAAALIRKLKSDREGKSE
jgi:hypothetical protein